MKYRFIEEQRRYHCVGKMAAVLGVSRTGYYAWKKRPHSARRRGEALLVELIKAMQKRVRYRYGSPRITRQLAREGVRVGHNRVARILRAHGLGRRARKRFRSTTNSEHKLPVAKNLLNRQFEVAQPNRVWTSDISYIATAEGWLYLCVVIDLFSRKVIGWAMSRRMKAKLVVQALLMALMRRRWPRAVIFHSDRGSQYCSLAVRKRIETHGLVQSMSRKGDCWDNAPTESFFNTLKSELCGERAFRTRVEARAEIFRYIEIFYNRQRLHSTLGYVPPVEYEEARGQKAS